MKQKIFSLLLAAMMVTTTFNNIAYASSPEDLSSEETKIASEICGYTEEGAKESSQHQHEDNCYEQTEVCVHEHSAECCVPDSARQKADVEIASEDIETEWQPDDCTHDCTEESGCIQKILVCSHEQVETALEGTLGNQVCDQYKNVLNGSENAYEVSDENTFNTAVQTITGDITISDASIIFKADVNVKGFSGIAGKHITLKSDSGALLTFSSDTIKLTGGLTFENIHISPKIIYAQGNDLTLGEGFGGGSDGKQRMIVYGGSDGNLSSNTSITILDGVYKLISGGNSAGTLTGNTHIIFGGNARFPTAQDGAETGDNSFASSSVNYNLYFDAEGEAVWDGPSMSGYNYTIGILPYGIYGGGINGNTTGDTTIEMNGGEVFQIFGGGAVRTNPTSGTSDLGQVGGNTNVSVTGGVVKSVYGGGYNDILVCSSTNTNDTADGNWRESRASVTGDTNVYIGGTASVPATDREEKDTTSGADMPAVYGGSFHSSVGNTSVIIGGNAKIENGGTTYGYGGVYGGGTNDIVQGGTYVEVTENATIGNNQNGPSNPQYPYPIVSQEKFSSITPLGLSRGSRCYLGGANYSYSSEIRGTNLSKKHTVNGKSYIGITKVSGGAVDVLMAGIKERPSNNGKAKTSSYTGNMLLWQTGGKVKSVEAGCTQGKKIVINGDIDTLIAGGAAQNYILGRYISQFSNGNTISVKCTVTFDGCGTTDNYLVAPIIAEMDSVHVTNNGYAAIIGLYDLYYAKNVPFYHVKDLTIDADAVLALKQNGEITGNLMINGALHLARNPKWAAVPALGSIPVTLTATGTAGGTGGLLPIAPDTGANYGIPSTPIKGEEYVFALRDGSDMMLTLANATNGLYVARKNVANSQDQDVWYIDQEISYSVTFDKNGGDTEPDPIQISGITSGNTVGALPDAPTRTEHTFDGWNTSADGTGTKFKADTPVTKNLTVYAQWRPVITFDTDGGKWGNDSSTVKKVAADVGGMVASPADPERGGYAFMGWYTQKNGAGVRFNETEVFTTPNIYYAYWKSNTPSPDVPLYTVTYDANGGSGPAPAEPAQYAQNATVTVLANTFTSNGKSFAGWKDGDGTSYAAGSTFKMPDKNVTLYAQWKDDKVPEKPSSPSNPSEPSNPTAPATPEEPSKPVEAPLTGDSSVAGLWIILSVFSGLEVIYCIQKRKRSQ